jgi:hypothetical protein
MTPSVSDGVVAPAQGPAPTDSAAHVAAQWLVAWERRDFPAMAAWTQPSWTEGSRAAAQELAHAYARRWLLAAQVLQIEQDDPYYARTRCHLVLGCATQPPVAIELLLQLTYEAGRWGVHPL